jgi:hypothetical protein
MCIICNMPDFKDDVASDFLNKFEVAQKAMKQATEAMLVCSKTAYPQYRPHYDAVHKEMVRQIREWNKLEEKREQHEPKPGAGQ